jgi:hypothetical protein
LTALFDFVDSQGAGGLWPGEYRLVSSYPRRVIEPPQAVGSSGSDGGSGGGGGSLTLEGSGLGAGAQVALLLEPIGAGGAGSP